MIKKKTKQIQYFLSVNECLRIYVGRAATAVESDELSGCFCFVCFLMVLLLSYLRSRVLHSFIEETILNEN